MSKVLKCPTCKSPVDAAAADAPFCSDRCRVIDLGAWAAGAYKISSPILDPDLLEDIEHAQQQARPMGETNGWKN